MNDQEKSLVDVTLSHFNMIRCMIAMAHIDGRVSDEERDYIAGLRLRLPLNSEQASVLDEDLSFPPNIADLLPGITDLKYRAQIICFSRLMAYKDGEFHPREKELLSMLSYYISKDIDQEALKSNILKAIQKDILTHDVKVQNGTITRGSHVISLFDWFDSVWNRLNL